MHVTNNFESYFSVTYDTPLNYGPFLNPNVMNSNLSEVEKSVLVMRLERNQNDLRQLRNKLNSYICEPKTHCLFERIESLRNGLEMLSSSNTQIMNSLKSHKKSVETYVNSTKEQLKKFSQLQQGVEDYIASARNC